MSTGPVQLRSIAALPAFRGAMGRFADEAAAALADLEIESNRAVQWITHEQRAYWESELRRSWELVAEARIALERAMIFSVPDTHPSLRDERKALDRAKQRQRTAEEKVEAVRHWSRIVERGNLDFHAALNQLAEWLQVEFPRAMTSLGRMHGALEGYVAVQAPAAPAPPVETKTAAVPATAAGGCTASAQSPATAPTVSPESGNPEPSPPAPLPQAGEGSDPAQPSNSSEP